MTEIRNYVRICWVKLSKFRYQLISRNPLELAVELCLASVDDQKSRDYYMENNMKSCDETIWEAPDKDRRKLLKNKHKRKWKIRNKKRRKFRKKVERKKRIERRSGGTKREGRKMYDFRLVKKKEKKSVKEAERDDSRISGSSVYLSDTDPTELVTSRHHPWQCSLRFQGFRGRHRCGVTLLSGPTEQSPSDPFVLVGAAHCNYICKDKRTGYPLETCCCRPESVAGSCRQNNPNSNGSPFCPRNANDAEFKLAEPDDLVIVCGEFDTEVELIWWSYEPEEVFKIEEIINHPNYKPNEVNISLL